MGIKTPPQPLIPADAGIHLWALYLSDYPSIDPCIRRGEWVFDMVLHHMRRLEHSLLNHIHLTAISRSLARRATCSGLTGHNRGSTTSSVREIVAFGGTYPSTVCVAHLVRYYGIALRHAPARMNGYDPSNGYDLSGSALAIRALSFRASPHRRWRSGNPPQGCFQKGAG